MLMVPGAGCRRGPAPVTRAQVIAAAPSEDEVGPEQLQEGIRVTFNRPVAPPGSIGRLIGAPALAVTPPLAGESRWLDPSTLGFFPKQPLRRSTAYQVSLGEGLVLAEGLKAAGWKGLRFVYDRVQVEDLGLTGFRELQPQKPTVILRASQPLAPDTATAACGFIEKQARGGEGRRIRAVVLGWGASSPDAGTDQGRDGELASALASGRALRLQPDQPLATATAYLVRCGPGLRPASGGEGLAKPAEEAFSTYGPAGIKAVQPSGREVAADGVVIRLEFTTPMDAREVRKKVSLRSPAGPVTALDLAADYRRTSFTWSGDLQPGTNYELIVGDGLVDSFGQKLPGQRRHSFRVGDASPRLEAETGIYAIERASGRYPMWTRNLSQLEVRCAPVPEGRLAAVLTGPANYDGWWDAASKESIDWKKLGLTRHSTLLRPEAPRNRWSDQTLALGSACTGGGQSPEGGAGVYLLELVTSDERNREGGRPGASGGRW